jgi:hypothetical protein
VCAGDARDGKEGVDGSSPSEGLELSPAQPRIPLSRLAACAGFGVHAASTSVHRGRFRRSARRAGGSRARGRRGRGGRSGGRSWSGWRPCSGRGRRWRCRHGARRWRRCGGDRRSCAAARFPPRAAPASTHGCESCAGRGSRPAPPGTQARCAGSPADVQALRARSPAAARRGGSPRSSGTSADPW